MMEPTVLTKQRIAPNQWNLVDTQSPVTRVQRTASALEAVAAALRAAELNYSDMTTMRTLVNGSGDLVELLAGVLSAQVARMEDCPFCAHPTQPLEVKDSE